MDIQAASNFERYLFYLLDSDATKTKEMMEEFAENGKIDLSSYLEQIKRDFASTAATEENVEDTIKDFYEKHAYVLDPHTAVGVFAANKFKAVGVPVVCLATAHPAKFGEIVEKAIGNPPEIPESLAGILEKPARCEIMSADWQEIQNYLASHS